MRFAKKLLLYATAAVAVTCLAHAQQGDEFFRCKVGELENHSESGKEDIVCEEEGPFGTLYDVEDIYTVYPDYNKLMPNEELWLTVPKYLVEDGSYLIRHEISSHIQWEIRTTKFSAAQPMGTDSMYTLLLVRVLGTAAGDDVVQSEAKLVVDYFTATSPANSLVSVVHALALDLPIEPAPNMIEIWLS